MSDKTRICQVREGVCLFWLKGDNQNKIPTGKNSIYLSQGGVHLDETSGVCPS